MERDTTANSNVRLWSLKESLRSVIDMLQRPSGPSSEVCSRLYESGVSHAGQSKAVPLSALVRRGSMIEQNPDIPEVIASLSEWHRWFAWYPVVIWTQGKRTRVRLRHIKRKLGSSRRTGERKWRYRSLRHGRARLR